MTEFHPVAEVRENVLHLQILRPDPIRSFQVRCVLDLTDFREVVGVEVLDLARQLDGGAISPTRSRGEISWSYDPEMDALYIHVAEGRGQVQRTAVATADVDAAGNLVRMTIPVPEPA